MQMQSKTLFSLIIRFPKRWGGLDLGPLSLLEAWIILPLLACCLLFTGCVAPDEAAPRIVYDPAGPDAQVVLPPVKRASPKRIRKGKSGSMADIPSDWYPPGWAEKQWSAVVVHHSATENGNMAIFDRVHREGNHWEGVGYDFVIGNGTDSADGQVEVTFRWHRQMVGAHCKTPGNWANENAVGICLVGNLDHMTPSKRQMASLAQLVQFLQRRYDIPGARIYGHKTMPGAKSTDCPGGRFSMSELHTLINGRS
jgi:hypothetical protein